jgi:CheY-like chemotaxis protein
LVRKILLADDSVTAQNMGRKILTDAGYEVVTVNNGSAALKRVAESKPDLIVLDLYMPGYSGLEVCQRLKDSDETAKIPILLTVGKLEPFKPEEARRVRADAHIVKPFEASELLTAITRMEERIASMQPEVSRSGSESGKKVDTSADTGWKSRLGFVSRKKKEETEEPAAGFRDFRKGKNKTNNVDPAPAGSASVASPAASKSAPKIPDIPRDITPEELDALSAVAAKLDAQSPAADKPAPPQESSQAKNNEENQNLATFAVEGPSPELLGASIAPPADDSSASQNAVAARVEPVAEASPNAEGQDQAQTVQTASLVEIPVGQSEPVAQSSEVATTPELLTAESASAQNSEQPVADSQAVPAVAQSLAFTAESQADNKASNVQAENVPSPVPDLAVGSNAVAGATLESKSLTTSQTEQTLEESIVAVSSEAAHHATPENPQPELAPTIAASSGATEAEVPAPSDEELAQALRMLTPSTSQGEAPTNPRWIAEPVALTPEEAAISLEAEMFGTFAARAAASIISSEPVRLSTIAAAVENRIAATESATGSNVEQTIQSSTAAAIFASGTSSEMTNANLAAIVAEVPSEVAESAISATAPSETSSAQNAAPLAREDSASAHRDPGQEASLATFANAIATTVDETAISAGQTVSVESSTAPVVGTVEANGQVTPTSEVENSMAKTKSGKNGQVSETDQTSYETTEKANAMAASAAADGGSTPAPDASAIASIVDSVMADLRPKIVEEIAKKLAGK